MNRLVTIICIILGLVVLFSFFELREKAFILTVLIGLVALAIYDTFQSKHAVLRNFPVIGHFRYILEFIRPEIQQYFIADNHNERPFNRETRTLIYERAKGVHDTIPFGTQLDIHQPGFESLRHSLKPTTLPSSEARHSIGGPECQQPYSASRLNVSAMSYGALSQNAIRALNKGAQLGNFAHNTGEGGLTPHHLSGGGDIIMQLGTAYFGCRSPEGRLDEALYIEKANLEQVKMIEVKLSQGAKPSHGGVLPASKITKEIAEIRGISRDQDCLSPPAHPEFDTPIGLLQFIKRLRDLSQGKPVGFKLCIGLRHEFLGICKAMLKTGILPDFITVDGAEGGTGAAPVEFCNSLGEPLNDALLFVHQSLCGIGVREHIAIIASGKIATGLDLITKLALGADTCNSARGMMFALGCIQSLQCHVNTCPTGVATQNPRLYRGLVVDDKAPRVANFHKATIHSCLELAGAMGLTSLKQLDPAHISHRPSHAHCKPYAELYPAVEHGALLREDIPSAFVQDWAKASAEHF